MTSSVPAELRETGAGHGKVCVWSGGVLWIGGGADRAGDVHAHHALQLSFSDEPALAFRPGDAAVWTSYPGCLIPADYPHAIDASHRPYANLFVDPESPEGRSLGRLAAESAGGIVRLDEGESRAAAKGAGGIVRLDEGESRAAAELLYGAWVGGADQAGLEAAAREVIRRFAGTAPPHALADPRVLAAIALIRNRLDQRVTLTDVARELHLSPSRLRHLFVEEVGLPFRTFVLWERLRRVIETIGTESLTQIALAAGFADAAHMTRTFRRMLGFAPSLLRQL